VITLRGNASDPGDGVRSPVQRSERSWLRSRFSSVLSRGFGACDGQRPSRQRREGLAQQHLPAPTFDTKEESRALAPLTRKGGADCPGALREPPRTRTHLGRAAPEAWTPSSIEYRRDPARLAQPSPGSSARATALRRWPSHSTSSDAGGGLLPPRSAGRLGVDEAADLRPAVYAPQPTVEALQIANRPMGPPRTASFDLIALVDQGHRPAGTSQRRHRVRESRGGRPANANHGWPQENRHRREASPSRVALLVLPLRKRKGYSVTRTRRRRPRRGG